MTVHTVDDLFSEYAAAKATARTLDDAALAAMQRHYLDVGNLWACEQCMWARKGDVEAMRNCEAFPKLAENPEKP